MSEEYNNDMPEIGEDLKIVPVFLLVDTSGSMEWVVEGSSKTRIDVVNENIRKMFNELAKNNNPDTEIDLCIISFADDAKVELDLCAADEAKWVDLKAYGSTNLSAALKMAKDKITDHKYVPNNSGNPVVILISDGEPNDSDWKTNLKDFVNNGGRTSKSERFALGIGNGTNKEMLKQFITTSKNEHDYLFDAKDATDIIKFFQYVTRSTLERVKSLSAVHANNQSSSIRPKTVVNTRRFGSTINIPQKKAPANGDNSENNTVKPTTVRKRNPFL